MRARIGAASGPPTQRLAIRPYPSELEETIRLGDGRELILRPVHPEDEPAFHETFAKLTPEEIRLRYVAPIKALGYVQAARFTQIDYDRERAEYAIIVRHDVTGMGLGVLLMRRIIDYAKGRSIGEIFGDVPRENTTMLRICQELGFAQISVADEPGLVRVVLRLCDGAAARHAPVIPRWR